MSNRDIYEWESKVFKNGNSNAIYIPNHIDVEKGQRYTFIVKELKDEIDQHEKQKPV